MIFTQHDRGTAESKGNIMKKIFACLVLAFFSTHIFALELKEIRLCLDGGDACINFQDLPSEWQDRIIDTKEREWEWKEKISQGHISRKARQEQRREAVSEWKADHPWYREPPTVKAFGVFQPSW